MSQRYNRCGVALSDEQIQASEATFKANFVPKPHIVSDAAQAADFTVPVLFHVISRDGTEAGGNLP